MFGAGFNVKDNFSDIKVREALDNTKTDLVLYSKAVTIKGMAIMIFESRVKHTHAPTLPTYASSFKINRVRRLASHAWRVINDDPAAFWVEFGAYIHSPGGHPMILKYKPLTRALDAIGVLE